MSRPVLRAVVLAASLAGLGVVHGGGRARADDLDARARFLADRDARALAPRLEASGSAPDRALAPLARLAADPAGRADAQEPSPLVRVVDALRVLDLTRARADAAAAAAGAGVPGVWVEALVAGRGGQDETATRRLLEAGVPEPARDTFALALLGAALPRDDRDLLAALVRGALVRSGAAGRLDPVVRLAVALADFDPASAARGLVVGARILRRGGVDREASALLDRREASGPAVALERALAAWRRGDAGAARAAAATVRAPAPWTWAFDALPRASAAPTVVPAPALAVGDAGANADAAALARLLAVLGAPARADELAARARQRGTTCADVAFVREAVTSAGGALLEVAGDAAPGRAASARGLPLLVRCLRRRADRFAEEPVLVRGFDAATDLLVVDEPDADRPDAMPAAWLGKLRYAVVAPKGRVAELAAWRETAAARAGDELASDLAPLARNEPERAVEALVARGATGAAERPFLTLYQGFAAYLAGTAARDLVRRGAAGTLMRRSSATPPVLAVERFVRTTESAWSRDEAEAAAADLAAIEADEGPCAWVHAARFVVYEAARRHAEALTAIVEARRLDPFDVRTLYFRGNLRRLLGDAPGAREDLVRVLDRRPDTFVAAEDLVALHLEAGAPDRALAVVEALVAADPASADSKPVRLLRQRTEVRVVRRARTAADLTALACSPEADTRKEVAWTAASFETPEAEAMLRTLLADPDEGVRRKAAQAYQRPWLVDLAGADPVLFAALVARLGADPVPTVREALVLAVAREESARSDAVLAPRLAGAARDADVGVRAAVADALTERETPDVRRALVAALEDPESVVRATALRGLVRLGGSARGFEPDDPPDKRAAAVRAWQAWLSAGR